MTTGINRRLAALGLLAAAGAPAWAQEWTPSQPTTLLVGFAPGGAAGARDRADGSSFQREIVAARDLIGKAVAR